LAFVVDDGDDAWIEGIFYDADNDDERDS